MNCFKEKNITRYFFISITVPVACTANRDCSHGHTCRDSMCLPHCLLDQECALNEKCLNGNCMRKIFFYIFGYLNIK